MRENKLPFSFASQEVITESGEKTGKIFLKVPPDYKSVDRMLTSGFIDANEFIFDRQFYSKILLPSYNVLVDKVYDSSLSDYFIGCLAALSGNINYEGEVLGEYKLNRYSVTPRNNFFTTKSFDKNAFLFSRYQTTLFAVIRANSVLKITDKRLLFNYISHISGDSLGFTFHFPGKTMAKETDRLPIKMFKFGLSVLSSSIKLSFKYAVFKSCKILNLFRKFK